MARLVEAYDEFMSNLFQSLHGAIKKENMIPITKVGRPEQLATLDSLGIDKNFVFQDPKGFIDKYNYWNGPVYVGLMNLSEDVLKMMRASERIKMMTEDMNSLMASNNWGKVFSMMEKKILIPMYIELFDRISDNHKYEVFMDLHVRSEFGFEMFDNDFIKKVFNYKTLNKGYNARMAAFDKNSQKNLTPEGKIKVYHGKNGDYNAYDEMSWTLSRKTASFFANRFQSKGTIVTRLIDRSEVQDYYNQRGEHEVIIFPELKQV